MTLPYCRATSLAKCLHHCRLGVKQAIFSSRLESCKVRFRWKVCWARMRLAAEFETFLLHLDVCNKLAAAPVDRQCVAKLGLCGQELCKK